MSQPPPLPTSPDDLSDPLLNAYIENFLDIADFRSIENGKALLDLIRLAPDHSKLKPAIRKVIGLFGCQAPAGRVCALQFLKEALEAGSFFTVESLQKSVLVHFAEIIEYRSPVRSIQRGSTYFCREFDKNVSDEQMMNLVKLSSTFFRMVHECLYVWGALYFPGSAFDRLRLKLEKKVAFPEFPKEFKFYSETKVNNFKERFGDLIRRVQEKSVLASAEGNSVVERRTEIVGKERKDANSPRSIKKTKQPIKQQPSSKQIKQPVPVKQQAKVVNEQSVMEELQRQKEDAALDNPPSSKRTKRHKSKKNKSSKKQFIENIKEEGSEKGIETNSSKLRKKNSFIEVPFDLEKQIHQQKHPSSKEINKLDQSKSRDLPSKATTLIKPIQQNEESDGGRYSMDEAISKQSEINEIMYEYNKREAQSPRSQYSLKNKQSKEVMLRRENSEQLPPSITARGKDIKKQAKVIVRQQQTQKNKGKQQQQKQMMVQSKQQASPAKKQHSFKLPLNQLKGKIQVAPPQSKPQSSERRQDKDKERKSTARKKFVSSQEQSMKEIRQQELKNQQIPTIVKQFNDNSSLEYQREAKNNVKMTKHQNKEAVQQKQQRNDPTAIPPRPKQTQTQIAKEASVQQPMPVKTSKPIKLKSNSNLKTVFESSGYKVVELLNKNDDQNGNKQGNKVNNQQKQSQQNTLALESKKNSKNASEMPEIIKQSKKTSIFQAVEVDTIQTINELTPLTRKPDTKTSSPAKAQLYEVPEQPSLKVTIRRQQASEGPKDDREVTHRQVKTPAAARDQRSVSLQNKPLRKGTQQQSIQHHQNLTILHKSRQTDEEHRSIEVLQQQLRPIRRNTTFSSRFRHFKEVNLFIQPKNALSLSPSQPLMPPQAPIDSDLKLHFMEELNKIKTVIIQRQQTMNLTLMSLRSEMAPDRKISEETKIETGTQTKLRHKSKGKFQRKNKYRLFDDLSKSQENISQINLPKEAPQPTKQIPLQTPSQQATASMQRKKSTLEKQQLKPNTLLHALYKRKYSNI